MFNYDYRYNFYTYTKFVMILHGSQLMVLNYRTVCLFISCLTNKKDCGVLQ